MGPWGGQVKHHGDRQGRKPGHVAMARLMCHGEYGPLREGKGPFPQQEGAWVREVLRALVCHQKNHNTNSPAPTHSTPFQDLSLHSPTCYLSVLPPSLQDLLIEQTLFYNRRRAGRGGQVDQTKSHKQHTPKEDCRQVCLPWTAAGPAGTRWDCGLHLHLAPGG